MKKVSIIIPVYNVEQYIEECLGSVLSQTYPAIEILLIENGSTDQSLELIRKYQAFDQVRIIVQDCKTGPGGARNAGVAAATGEYIAFVDGDDRIEPTMIEKMVQTLEEYQSSVVMCKHSIFWGPYREKKRKKSAPTEILDFEKNPEALESMQGQCWNKLYKKEIIKRFPFPEDINFEDAAVTYAIMIAAKRVPYIQEELYHYRRNWQGITLSNKIPNRGTLDLYKAMSILEDNCASLRKDNRYDDSLTRIEHSILMVSAIDSACWITIPHKTHKRIVNCLAFLANRKYGFVNHMGNPMIERGMKRLLYFGRIKWFEHFLDPDFEVNYSDKDILEEVDELITGYQKVHKKR